MSNSKFGCQDPILKKNDSKLAGFFVEKETNILVFAELSNGTAYIGIVNKDDKDDSQSTKPLRQFLYEYDLLDIKDSFWMPRKKDGHSNLVDFKVSGSPFNSSKLDDGFDVVRGIFNDKVGYQDIPLTVLLSDYECISFNRCTRLNAEHYVANMNADIYNQSDKAFRPFNRKSGLVFDTTHGDKILLNGIFVDKETAALMSCQMVDGFAFINRLTQMEINHITKMPISQFLQEHYLVDLTGSIWVNKNTRRMKREGNFEITKSIRTCYFKESSKAKQIQVVSGRFDKRAGAYVDVMIDVLLKDYKCVDYSQCKNIDAEQAIAGMDAYPYDSIKTSTDYEHVKQSEPSMAAIGFGDIFELAGSKWVDDKGAHKAKASLTLFGLVFSVNTSLTANQLDIDINLDNKGADQ